MVCDWYINITITVPAMEGFCEHGKKTFRSTLLDEIPPKRWYLYTRLFGATPMNAVVLIFTALRITTSKHMFQM
jgi:hypothetical protein